MEDLNKDILKRCNRATRRGIGEEKGGNRGGGGGMPHIKDSMAER